MIIDFLRFFLGEERTNILLKYAPALLIILILILFFLGKLKFFSYLYSCFWKLKTKFRDLEILEANYGANGSSVDVTLKLNKEVKNNELSIKVSNDLAGDPSFGYIKIISVKYRYKGVPKTIIAYENDYLKIP